MRLARLSIAPTDPQRRRLQTRGDNLILLHWNLRQAGSLEQPEQSSYHRSAADFQTFIEQTSAAPSISKTNATPEMYLKPQLGEETT